MEGRAPFVFCSRFHMIFDIAVIPFAYDLRPGFLLYALPLAESREMALSWSDEAHEIYLKMNKKRRRRRKRIV